MEELRVSSETEATRALQEDPTAAAAFCHNAFYAGTETDFDTQTNEALSKGLQNADQAVCPEMRTPREKDRRGRPQLMQGLRGASKRWVTGDPQVQTTQQDGTRHHRGFA